MQLSPESARPSKPRLALGPPSLLIKPSLFAENASQAWRDISEGINKAYENLTETKQISIGNEIRLKEALNTSEQILKNKDLSKIFSRGYEQYAVKRKEHDPDLPPLATNSNVTLLSKFVSQATLQHWPPSQASINYIRKIAFWEENVLDTVGLTENGAKPTPQEVILIINLFSSFTRPLGKNEKVLPTASKREATLALLGSQTLQDLFDAFPCSSNNILALGKSGNSIDTATKWKSSGGMIIEDTAYGLADSSWADDVVAYCKERGNDSLQISRAGTSLNDTFIRDLDLCLQKPYWMYHQGYCHHHFVVEQIRLFHESDLPAGYPITLFLSRHKQPTCRLCGQNPITLAINGDVRLGESPFLICNACWTDVGQPDPNSDVLVVPYSA